MNVPRRSVRVRLAVRLRRSFAGCSPSSSRCSSGCRSPSVPRPPSPPRRRLRPRRPMTASSTSCCSTRPTSTPRTCRRGRPSATWPPSWAPQYDQPVTIQETDDPAAFTTANLATADAVVFAQTGGVLFNDGTAHRARGLHPRRRRLHGHALRRLVGRPERARRQPVLRPARRRRLRGPPGEPRRPPGPRGREGRRPPAHGGPARRASPAATSGTTGSSTRRPTSAPCSRPTSRPTAWAARAPRTRSPGARRSTPAGPGTPAWATRAPPTPSPTCAPR